MEKVKTRNIFPSQTLSYKHSASSFLIIISAIFLFVSIVVATVPISPTFPKAGLDPSWKFAMSYAIATHMDIGKDIIFTFGPYASIFTHEYHPGAEALTLKSSAILALAYFLVLSRIIRINAPVYLFAAIGISISILCNAFPINIILFTYCFISSLLIFSKIGRSPDKNKPYELLIISLIAIPFGLLFLVKGSLLPIVMASAGLIALNLLVKRQLFYLVVFLLCVVLSTMFFWVAAQQSLENLASYFLGIGQMSVGYSQAMSTNGSWSHINLYLATCFSLAAIIVFAKNQNFENKIFILLTVTLLLFITFKAGFVRHDGHAYLSANMLIIVSIYLFLSTNNKYFLLALALSLTCWSTVNNDFHKSSVSSLYAKYKNSYLKPYKATLKRVNKEHWPGSQFKRSISRINSEYQFPSLEGDSDIFSFNQSYLLASENQWNPRPVFQSYSAFNKYLIENNLAHYRSAQAPDNIFFRIEPIDGRLPSLDDGALWPLLLNQYSIDQTITDYLVLKRNGAIKNQDGYLKNIGSLESTFGTPIEIPDTGKIIYMTAKFYPTALGIIKSILFKENMVHVLTKIEGGHTAASRLIPNMTEAGFVISPFVRNIDDFTLLYEYPRSSKSKRAIEVSFVENFVLTADWKNSIHIEFYELTVEQSL